MIIDAIYGKELKYRAVIVLFIPNFDRKLNCNKIPNIGIKYCFFVFALEIFTKYNII